MQDVLAVVGSTSFVDVDALDVARGLIEGVIGRRRPDVIVSGAAAGIDSLAAQIAAEHGIEVREFPPAHPRWQPQGYRERNDRIADTCSRLMRVVCRWSVTYGSGYTHDRAREQGKLCWSVRLPSNLLRGSAQVVHTGGTVVRLPVEDGKVLDVPGYVRALGWGGRDADRLLSSLVRRRYPVRWSADHPQ